jgi:hypothetical protein
MKRDNGQGMFTMDFINEIAVMKDLAAAKVAVGKQVEASTATPENKAKAYKLINTSTSINRMVIGLGNFSLSHQGLSVR